MIHVVFNSADVDVLAEAATLDETLAGEIIQIKDDYAVGPISDLQTDEGRSARKQWWRAVLADGDYAGKVDESDDDPLTADRLITALKENADETIWVWAAQNAHDVCGYYWLLDYLSPFRGRVFILYLNNLPFINNEGNIFYPEWLHEIPAKEFLKAKKLAREITASEFEVDPDEWQRLETGGKTVRRLEGGKKLAMHDEDFFDAEIRKFISGEFKPVSKIIRQYLTKSKFPTGDAFLLWRLKSMVGSKMLEAQGEMRTMKDFEVSNAAK